MLTHIASLEAAMGGVVLAVLGDVTIVQDALVAVGVGTVIARLLIYRLERQLGRELSARRSREIEAAWIVTTLTSALLIDFVVEVA